MVMVEASRLSALTMVISAKTLRLPGLIFLLVLAIQTLKDVATDMSVVITRAYNVGPSSIEEATCFVTSRQSILTGDLRVHTAIPA